MKAKAFFEQSLASGGTCFGHITPGQFANSTPCTEWNLKQLINHMIYELMWLPDIVSGKTIQEVGDVYDGDLVGDNPIAAWDVASTKALAAVKKADLNATAHLSYGDVPMEKYITECGCDMLIHGWDAAQAVKCTLHIKDELAQSAYEYYAPLVKKEGIPGVFGARVETEDNASLQTRLLALVGRKA